jgi:etoposide-induced 2.4 mRNA
MRKSILRNSREQANRTRPQATHPASAPSFASARASYPVFLALHDTLKLQIGWAWRGLVDAFRWDVVIGLMTRNVCFLSPLFYLTLFLFVDCFSSCSDAEVRANALKSFLLNGISLVSIYVFDLLLHPLSRGEGGGGEGAHVQSQKNGLHRTFGWFYRILWLLPVVGMSLYLNVRDPPPCLCWCLIFSSVQASWCSLIAKRTFTLRHGLAYPYMGMSSTTSPNAYIAFLNSLATSAYRAVMIATCVFVSFALGYVPVIGGVVETIFFCWVNA